MWLHASTRHAGLLQGGDTASLQEFGDLFNDVKFRKGLQLNFTSANNGDLIAQIDNEQVSLQMRWTGGR